MITGEKYYIGNHDILKRKRTVIGKDGTHQEVSNLPNNKIIDNQYARLVDQKNSYLLAKPLTFISENLEYTKNVRELLGYDFFRIIKNIGEDALNCGIAWLYIFINDNGDLDFKSFRPYEILPFWKDSSHSELDTVARVYDVDVYQNGTSSIITKVELYTSEGVEFFTLENFTLIPSNKSFLPYIHYQNKSYKWGSIPLIPFKFNSKEIPLISKVKSLQDSLNTIISDFMNNIQEDARNSILVLKNYDGTNLEEFRKNLSTYGVVKVKTIDGSDGDVDVLKVNVDSNNFIAISSMLKRAIVENSHGFDVKDDKLMSNPNQLNIKAMYSDVDLDASLMETEFQAAFYYLFKFINTYFSIIGKGDFFTQSIKVIFNKDLLINETEVIENCVKSKGIISDETIISQHPWANEADIEISKVCNH